MVHEYYNPEKEESKAEDVKEGEEATGGIEVAFKFPKEDNCVISKMSIKLGDTLIQAKVQDKVKAEEKYDDAVGEGNLAALLQEKDDIDLHEVGIGNVLPGQTVVVEMCLI